MHPEARGREILFHHPLPVLDNPRTGSQIRPRRMLDAFRAIGYEVVEVTGYSSERVPMMKHLGRQIRDGRRFEFCYSECVTSPTALSDTHHLPTHPIADPKFFRTLKQAGIPSGLFYRDVYWRFDEYRRKVPLPKRFASAAFYHFDLAWYRQYLDIVYLPSLGMAASVPGSEGLNLKALPPGMSTRLTSDTQRTNTPSDGLRLFYVGSITPPIYDMTMLLSALKFLPKVQMTLCFPESELGIFADYPKDLTDLVEICHSSGPALDDHYANSDAACLIMGPHPYRDFAMPVKLFEAIGHGRPLVSNADTAAGRFISTEKVGWVFNDQ
ncbi:MAG: hypothetical protein KDB26_12640, partial [Microthrixaceae bacterium]|nr:hypothetical protein [Microthrixaceae bacterium]